MAIIERGADLAALQPDRRSFGSAHRCLLALPQQSDE